ncbi:MAG: response regulator transcription factor [Dehalococcoidales bacterium]|nr:response regulator transcription factor [Dehalococcoidales bacterium]
MIKVMVVDEETFFRLGLNQVLSQRSDFEVVDCDPAQEPLMETIEASSPDVVILGSNLRTQNGLSLAREIAKCYPYIRVILLSSDPSDEVLFETIKTAAAACLSKNVRADTLVDTIKRTFSGEYPINESLETRPMVARRVLEQFEELSSLGKPLEEVIAPLTRRETQILTYIAEGNTNKEIANKLEISEQTVKSHVSAILRKLNANDRAHAVALVMRQG